MSLVELRPNLGELLMDARKKYGYNKKQMATLLGLDESTYGRLENGITRKMSSKDIERFKRMQPYLGLPYPELLAAAGIRPESEREVFYDFDASEIDYFSAVKDLYKADPHLFSYAKSISSMPIERIRLIERMIEMFLDEDLERDPFKRLVAENIVNNLELYGMCGRIDWEKTVREKGKKKHEKRGGDSANRGSRMT